MNFKTLLATLVGGTTAFIGGFLLFGILLRSYFDSHMVHYAGLDKDHPNFATLVLANIMIAWIFAIVMHWSGRRGFMGGATIGAVLGASIIFMNDLFLWSLNNHYTDFMVIVVHVVVNIFFSAIVGGVVGLMMNIGKREAASV